MKKERTKERLLLFILVVTVLAALFQINGLAQEIEQGTIQGRVTDDQGKGVAGLEVVAMDARQEGVARCISGSNGEYEFLALPAGEYRIYVTILGEGTTGLMGPSTAGDWLGQWAIGKDYFNSADSYSVAAGKRTVVPDIRLVHGASLSGRVIGWRQEAMPSVNIRVFLENESMPVAETASDVTGSYRFERLPPGAYRIFFQPDDKGPYFQCWYPQGGSIAKAAAVPLTAGQKLRLPDQVLVACGEIEGRVTGEDGMAVEGVRVQVKNLKDDYVDSVLTDAGGVFRFQRLFPARYKLHFEADEKDNYYSRWYPAADSFAAATELNVESGKTIDGLHIRLKTGGCIRGRITDENGQPLAKVEVNALGEDQNQAFGTLSDAHGNFVLNRLTAGKYKVFFRTTYYTPEFLSQWYGGQEQQDKADAVAVAPQQTVSGIDGRLRRGSSISGRVSDSAGKGIAGVWVEAFSPTGYNTTSGQTDSDGRYRILGLKTDRYLVAFNCRDVKEKKYIQQNYREHMFLGDTEFGRLSDAGRDAADPVAVALGKETTGIDAVLRLFGSISGRLTDGGGKGIAHANVSAYAPEMKARVAASGSSSLFFSSGRSRSVISEATTRADGSYQLEKLPPGKYRLHFSSSSGSVQVDRWYRNRDALENADEVPLEEGQNLGEIDMRQKENCTISGRVTSSGGVPLANINVELNDMDKAQVLHGNTDGKGDFFLQGVEKGKYKIHFSQPYPADYLPCWYAAADRFEDALVLDTNLVRDIRGIHGRMERGGTIGGRIVDSQGKPVNNYTIEAVDAQAKVIARVTSDEEGTYLLRPLPQGDYRIHFIKYPLHRFPEGWHDGQTDPAKATVLQVGKGGRISGIDYTVPSGCTISGRVTDVHGKAIAGVWVRLNTIKNEQVAAEKTDEKGDYQMRDVPPGAYKIYFDVFVSENLLSVWYPAAETVEQAQAITLEAGSSAMRADARLPYGGGITGTVSGKDGIGISSVLVKLSSDSVTDASFSATTDLLGKYRFLRLRAGTYRVHAMPADKNNMLEQEYPDSVRVVHGKVTSGIDLHLQAGGGISGLVCDENGKGVSDFVVNIYDAGGVKLCQTTSDGEGKYSALRLKTGKYKVLFHSNFRDNLLSEYYAKKESRATADLVAVEEGKVTSGIDTRLAVGGIIRGNVKNTRGVPLAGVEVVVHDLKKQPVAGIRTDEFGDYVIFTLETGVYKVYFQTSDASVINQWYQNQGSFETAAEVRVKAGKTTGRIDAIMLRRPN